MDAAQHDHGRMGVRIDKARNHSFPAAVHNFRSRNVQGLGRYFRDAASVYQDVDRGLMV